MTLEYHYLGFEDDRRATGGRGKNDDEARLLKDYSLDGRYSSPRRE